MEGVLIVIKAWGLAALMIWVHRRFFERVARAEPGFEAWCTSGPLIAALHVAPGQIVPVEAALRASLGKRQRLVATLGGWPWPNYDLEIRLARVNDVLRLSIVRAELRKTHPKPEPALVLTLRELLNAHAGSIDDVWLLAEIVYGSQGPSQAPQGWTVLAGKEPRPQVRPRAAVPSWLVDPKWAGESAATPSMRLSPARAEA
jgi:hypothetical protein